ncbi:hypothetical protein COB57_05520 [Candidatus Peregrinibacteria bacterium]|nr:MAG: hypothetical protein COB57_05520 [Candidatus Peregrinibacteria bacterium]
MVIETTLDLMYFTASISIGTLTILIGIICLKLIRVLSQVETTTQLLQETSELINNYAWKPIEVLYHLKEFFTKHILKK